MYSARPICRCLVHILEFLVVDDFIWKIKLENQLREYYAETNRAVLPSRKFVGL